MSKTIEIDDSAYDCLERARRPDEEWSALIRRCVKAGPSFQDVLQKLRSLDVSVDTLEAIDDAVTRRRQASPSRSRS